MHADGLRTICLVDLSPIEYARTMLARGGGMFKTAELHARRLPFKRTWGRPSAADAEIDLPSWIR